MVTYALRGITYFVRHPALWKEVAFPLLLTVLYGVAAAYFLFFHTFSRQQDWLDDKNIPKHLATILALCIVGAEIFVSTIIYGVVCVDYFEHKIFGFVLRDRGLGALLDGREHRSTVVLVCTSYFMSSCALKVISLPLHLIPVLGSIVYAWLHGGVLAWEYHHLYFELKGFTLRQQQRWMRRYKTQYSTFGLQAMLLEMVPCAGPFFIFTNTCGAALLAEELERDNKKIDEEDTLVDSGTNSECDAVKVVV
ncbi:Kinesin protein [Phytophthora cinnamomi]|uniref:Kinesin protein n=1 Tax=Phytophthora cinnamomi TaxID=4785 RepID=UPI00355A6B10|nr:Kinesin protein [Phytophthora cinnamomi]